MGKRPGGESRHPWRQQEENYKHFRLSLPGPDEQPSTNGRLAAAKRGLAGLNRAFQLALSRSVYTAVSSTNDHVYGGGGRGGRGPVFAGQGRRYRRRGRN